MSGGAFNDASGANASIGGGCDNLAGTGTVPSGACGASGLEAILGGSANTATGEASTIQGGERNDSSASWAAIAGGQDNQASDLYAFIGGGCANTVGAGSALLCSGGDLAPDPGAGSEAILGGQGNYAGRNGSGTLLGFASAVAGGNADFAFGQASTILGGDSNQAMTACESIPSTPGSC